ncbi:MAG TPA: hypothetical protein VK196_18495 [Magnetospirillum sp.]|nr:hypothetical protein [Magnetospirillum sp.]
MKSAIFLSARSMSTRLPRKLFQDIEGRTVFEHLVERLRLSKKADMVMLTTGTHPNDLELVALAEKCGIPAFRGNSDDKLIRYLDAADAHGVDFIAVVDGDDVFCDAASIDRIIEHYRESQADYIIVDDLPLGATAFGVRVDALREVCRIKLNDNTEVWGGYFTKTGRFRTSFLPAPEACKRPSYRMTLDYQEDLNFFRAVFAGLGAKTNTFPLSDICALLDNRPDIVALNADVQALYEARLASMTNVRIREEGQE